MKFLIDENLPPILAEIVRQSGYESIHINEFANQLPISDNAIRRFALHKNWIVVTRDDDFVKSFVSRKVPEKVLFLFDFKDRHGIVQQFREKLEQIVADFENADLLELNPRELKVHF